MSPPGFRGLFLGQAAPLRKGNDSVSDFIKGLLSLSESEGFGCYSSFSQAVFKATWGGFWPCGVQTMGCNGCKSRNEQTRHLQRQGLPRNSAQRAPRSAFGASSPGSGLSCDYFPGGSKYPIFKNSGPKRVWHLEPESFNIGYLDPRGLIWGTAMTACSFYVLTFRVTGFPTEVLGCQFWALITVPFVFGASTVHLAVLFSGVSMKSGPEFKSRSYKRFMELSGPLLATIIMRICIGKHAPASDFGPDPNQCWLNPSKPQVGFYMTRPLYLYQAGAGLQGQTAASGTPSDRTAGSRRPTWVAERAEVSGRLHLRNPVTKMY